MNTPIKAVVCTFNLCLLVLTVLVRVERYVYANSHVGFCFCACVAHLNKDIFLKMISKKSKLTHQLLSVTQQTFSQVPGLL